MKELIYIQILSKLRDKINQGLLKPGDILPSENDLSQEFEASRVTVRKSLSLLEHEGYIYSAPGKGYFVREPVSDKYILHFNEMDSIESIDSSKLVEVNVIWPGPETKFELQLPEDKKVIVIRRVLISSNKPVAYDVKYLPYERGLPIVEKEIKYATFPEMVSKKASLFSLKKDLKISALTAQGEISKLLDVEENHPLLVIEQKLYTGENRPIGWGRTYFKSEFCKLNAAWSFGQRLYENR